MRWYPMRMILKDNINNHNHPFIQRVVAILFHIFIDGLTEIVDGLLVALLRRIEYAVAQVILKDELAGVVDGAAHGGDLYEHLGAIPSLLHHAAYRLKMADGAAETVEHGAGMLVAVNVGMAVVMVMAVIMLMFMGMGGGTVLMAVGDAQRVHQGVGLLGGGNIVVMVFQQAAHLFERRSAD